MIELRIRKYLIDQDGNEIVPALTLDLDTDKVEDTAKLGAAVVATSASLDDILVDAPFEGLREMTKEEIADYKEREENADPSYDTIELSRGDA